MWRMTWGKKLYEKLWEFSGLGNCLFWPHWMLVKKGKTRKLVLFKPLIRYFFYIISCLDYYSHLTSFAQTFHSWVFKLSSFFFCKAFYKASLPLNITPSSCLFPKLPCILVLWRSLKKNRFSKLPFKSDGPFVKVAVFWVSTIGIFLLLSQCHGLSNNCRCHQHGNFLVLVSFLSWRRFLHVFLYLPSQKAATLSPKGQTTKEVCICLADYIFYSIWQKTSCQSTELLINNVSLIDLTQ